MRHRWHPLRLGTALLVVMAGLSPVWAQPSKDNFEVLLLRWDFQLDMVELELGKEAVNKTLLEALLPQIEKVGRDAQAMRDDAEQGWPGPRSPRSRPRRGVSRL